MTLALYFSKLPSETRDFQLDLSSLLSSSEQIISISGLVVSPVDVTLTITTSIVGSGKIINIHAVGGTSNLSYTITFTSTTSLAQVIQRSVGLSLLDSASVLPSDSDISVPTLSGSLNAGDSVLANVIYTFPAGSVLTSGSIGWALFDNSGLVHASGSGNYTLNTTTNGSVQVVGSAVVSTPSNLDPTDGSISYQLRWDFTHSSLAQPVYSYEPVQVLSKYETNLGVEDTIELIGTTATINCVLDRAYNSVQIEIYDSTDTVILVATSVKSSETQVSGGVAYSYQYTTTSLVADLVPRTVCFKYQDGSTNSPVNRSFGRLYLVNTSVLAACEDLRMFINRTNTTIVGQPDMIFTHRALLTFLRMGRDYFNMVFQLTNFTMSRASGGIRDGWLMCSSIRALRSQFMAEGEQAFDYQGQAISLNVDRTQYYDSLASNLESQLEMFNKFKSQLTKRGITSGDGDLSNTNYRAGNVAAVGLNVTAISPYSFGMGYRRRPLYY